MHSSTGDMILRYTIVAIILLAGMVWSTLARKLTFAGALAGGLTGMLVFAGAGFTGLLMMTAFFLLGTLATSWKHDMKERLGVAEENKSGRTAGQVIANAGVAALLGSCVLLYPVKTDVLRLMMAAGFSSAAADTLSSELGNIYGRRYYNILSFRKDIRGLNGVISLEGTLFGVAGSIIIALVYAVGFGFDAGFIVIILSGTIGNLVDSVLGATLERKHCLNNDVVNCINTLVAALAACALHRLFS